MVRPLTDVSGLCWRHEPRLKIFRADLRCKDGLAQAVAGVDAVLHTAAAKEGDLYTQLAGTVVGTENLLEAMSQAGVERIVAVSSLSVYCYRRLRVFSVLDESSPVETDSAARDEYCRVKLLQENLVREHAHGHKCSWTILRPGVIYGKDNLWTARLGVRLNPRVWILIGLWSRLPLTYVENCAEATVLAAENEKAVGQTLNIIDNDLPTQIGFAWELRRRLNQRPRLILLPRTVVEIVARLAQTGNFVFFRGDAKLPSVLIPARLSARCKPLRYSNLRIRQVLGWVPRFSRSEALNRSFNDDVSSEGIPQILAATR